MASSKPARLKVILGKNNIEKLTFPNGIPDSLNELLSKVKDNFGLKTNIRLQYMDKDFDNDFFNLNSTKDIEDLGTIKVIEQQSIESLIDVIETVSPFSTIHSDESSSLASDDPIILSFCESSSSRTQQWPAIFPIPLFSYDTERQLEKGNSEYKANNKMLKVTFRMKTDILNRVAEEIYKYKAYPDDAHFCLVAEALIKKHPCLKEPGFFNGCYGWKQRLKYKMANYRVLLKSQGCAEVSVNTLKSKASTGSCGSPAAKIKKPRQAEVNFYPSFPLEETQSTTIHSDESSSLASDDPIILSFRESSSSRTQQWPAIFPIPLFSYDTERQLEKGNFEYKANNKMLKVTFRMKTDILNRVAEEIYKYRAYPDDAHFCLVAEALIKKHPCLKEPGFFNGCYGWKRRLKYKMANYRVLLNSQGCAEVSVNTLKSKASTGSCVSPAAKIKKPRRAEANFYPSFPLGETQESMEKERLELLTAIKRSNNDRVIADKMAWTFAYRRQEVVNEEPGIEDFKNRWPALFQQKEINAEFQRLVALPLEQTFMAQLDRHSSQLIKVILAKGGATHAKTAGIMKTYDEVEDIDIRRECVLKSLITFVGEDAEDLIKEYCGISGDDAQMELKHLTMAVFVIRKEGERLKEPPEDIGIVIEGVMVLHDLTSVASACALLLGLIYVLNLAYPKTLRFTFEVFQKIFMQLEQHKMSYKVHNLFGKLQSSQ